MGIRTVIVLSIIAMVAAVILLLIWIDQRRQQQRFREVARFNREDRERRQQQPLDAKKPVIVDSGTKRMIIDPLVADFNEEDSEENLDILDNASGIISKARVVSQPASPYKTPSTPTARVVQVSASASTTTRTPRITPFSSPSLGQSYSQRQSPSGRFQSNLPSAAFRPERINPTLLHSPGQAQVDSKDTEETSCVGQDYSSPALASTDSITPTPASSQYDQTPLTQSAHRQEPSESPIPDYLTFSLMAEPGKTLGGYDLLQAILGTGMRHGERQIFHRYDPKNPDKILFSLASIAKPGTFALDSMGAFSTPGLIFIFEIERGSQLLNSFELLLETARQLNEELDSNLLDDRREPLTTERIQALRQQLRTLSQVDDFVEDFADDL